MEGSPVRIWYAVRLGLARYAELTVSLPKASQSLVEDVAGLPVHAGHEWPYVSSVSVALLWPSRAWTSLTLAPLRIRRLAWKWRRSMEGDLVSQARVLGSAPPAAPCFPSETEAHKDHAGEYAEQADQLDKELLHPTAHCRVVTRLHGRRHLLGRSRDDEVGPRQEAQAE